MPTAVKLQEEYGDEVQVIFVHCQQASKDEQEAFAWRQKWRGNLAMWTEERPFDTKGGGLPETALVGIDGTILVQGNPGALGKKLEEALEAELEKARKAPDGTPKELAKAWTAFGKGDVAAAILECDKLTTDEAKSARAEFVSRTEKKIERVQWLADNGYFPEAEAQLGKLQKSAKGVADLAPKLEEASKKLADESLKSEREASAAVDKMFDKIAKDKPFDEGNVKKVQALADKYKGTKAGARAERFVELSKVKLKSAE